MSQQSVIAVDLGATSGRVVLATFVDGRVSLDEVHRFSTAARSLMIATTPKPLRPAEGSTTSRITSANVRRKLVRSMVCGVWGGIATLCATHRYLLRSNFVGRSMIALSRSGN